MSYIEFDKNQLINLEYSLSRELLRSNRAGAYASMTIIGCNTRKYHGRLVVPQPHIDNENHILLSDIDETVIQHDAEFNLGIRRYPGGIYNPKGHKYIRDFGTDPIPYIIYRVGGVVLKKEMVFMTKQDRILYRYTLLEAHSPTILRLKPFLAFRNVHKLSKANMYVNDKYQTVDNGISMRLYSGYSPIFLQFSGNNEYTHVPDWYHDVEYYEELVRGYDYKEDLFVPGFFDLPIKKGESIIFSAGTNEANTKGLKQAFTNEVKNRIPRDNFENCLINAAHQFVVTSNKKTEVIAGFPWFSRWGRDTFIALPGLTLSIDNAKECKKVLDSMVKDLKGPLFPNVGEGEESNYHSVDAPLWFFWALQQYSSHIKSYKKIYTDYGSKMKLILNAYRDGTDYNIKMQDDGLIYAGKAGIALSWMDAIAYGKPVTARTGKQVEINALWYNAIMFTLDLAKRAGDDKFVKEWETIAEMIPESFVNEFWEKEKGYLADYVDGEYKDFSVRPNQIIAASLPFSPVDDEIKHAVVNKVEQELLTSRGLRTLSPKNPDYIGVYQGDQPTRDSAYHQGTVWPWLLGHFVEAYLKIYGRSGLSFVENLYHGFEEVMTEAGIGTISEVYDGDPPHKAGGCISQAWSVSELLRIKQMIDSFNKIS